MRIAAHAFLEQPEKSKLALERASLLFGVAEFENAAFIQLIVNPYPNLAGAAFAQLFGKPPISPRHHGAGGGHPWRGRRFERARERRGSVRKSAAEMKKIE